MGSRIVLLGFTLPNSPNIEDFCPLTNEGLMIEMILEGPTNLVACFFRGMFERHITEAEPNFLTIVIQGSWDFSFVKISILISCP